MTTHTDVEHDGKEYDLVTQVIDAETTDWWLVDPATGNLVFADRYDVDEATTISELDWGWLEAVKALR